MFEWTQLYRVPLCVTKKEKVVLSLLNVLFKECCSTKLLLVVAYLVALLATVTLGDNLLST